MTAKRLIILLIITVGTTMFFGLIAGLMFGGGAALIMAANPNRCPKCGNPMVSKRDDHGLLMGEDECRACGYGEYWP